MSTMSTHSSAILKILDGHGSSLVKKTTDYFKSLKEEELLLLRLRFMRWLEIKISQDQAGLVTLNYENMVFDSNYNTHHVYMASNGKSSSGFIDNLIHSEKYKSPLFCL